MPSTTRTFETLYGSVDIYVFDWHTCYSPVEMFSVSSRPILCTGSKRAVVAPTKGFFD